VATTFRPGDDIAWRCRIRGSDRRDDVSFVSAMRVISDTPEEVIAVRRPGDAVRRRITKKRGPAEHRHQLVVTWGDGWTEDLWRQYRVLVLKRKADEHAISLFWPDDSAALACWYIDLMSPLRRHDAGFDFIENGLDVVVEPDMASWKWKDADELEYAVANGVYSRAEGDELYAEGERAVERLRRERVEFERWRAWAPDPAWPAAVLPAGWGRL
jgi:predicted RNA-binding protein associated with RNAse of E/G family